jgi:hypothetical protein
MAIRLAAVPTGQQLTRTIEEVLDSVSALIFGSLERGWKINESVIL